MQIRIRESLSRYCSMVFAAIVAVAFWCSSPAEAVAAATAATVTNPCPAVGADTKCGIIINVLQTGNTPCPTNGCASISFTGQGPYDRIEDTLIGVVNSGKFPLTSIALHSSTTAFAFEGDGICGSDPSTGMPFVPAPTGCPFGPTGYEGPGVNFGSTSPDLSTGTVTFSPPIPPGGTAYFSLEESLTNATGCSSAINGSVPKPADGGANVVTTFTPNLGYSLAQAATLCGFTAWNWQQTVTLDPCADVFEAGSTTPLKAPPPYNDPPLNGYSYQHPPNAVRLPVYYNLFTAANDPLSLAANETATTLSFGDAPSDSSCLSGRADGSGKHLGFTMHLVGIVGALPGAGVRDTGVGFSYTTTFNGTTGGIHVRNSAVPVDPGSGTGGITVTAYNPTTSYQYPTGLGVLAINGVPTGQTTTAPPMLLGAGVSSVTSSGFIYSRVTQTFNSVLTLTNVSGGAISGPFQVVLDSLTPGVTALNTSGSFGGWSFITIPNATALAPGQSAKLTVQFANSGTAPITFSPLPYSGSFN
jgi:hypothetical protein